MEISGHASQGAETFMAPDGTLVTEEKFKLNEVRLSFNSNYAFTSQAARSHLARSLFQADLCHARELYDHRSNGIRRRTALYRKLLEDELATRRSTLTPKCEREAETANVGFPERQQKQERVVDMLTRGVKHYAQAKHEAALQEMQTELEEAQIVAKTYAEEELQRVKSRLGQLNKDKEDQEAMVQSKLEALRLNTNQKLFKITDRVMGELEQAKLERDELRKEIEHIQAEIKK